MRTFQSGASRLFRALAAVGLAASLLGLGADLLPGSQPGLGPLQVLLTAGGLALLVVGLVLARSGARVNLAQALRSALLVTLPTLLFLVLATELALAVAGFLPRYPRPVPTDFIEPAPWWKCDPQLGCRFDSRARLAWCDSRKPVSHAEKIRPIHTHGCRLNSQGFHDEDEFTAEAAAGARLRILVLGDSFAFGSSSTPGNSFVETLESELASVEVWNTALPGYGTQQAVIWLEAYAPIMRPDVVLLAFYGNDFEDNVYPLDGYYWGILKRSGSYYWRKWHIVRERGSPLLVRQYRLEGDGSVTRIEDQRELYYRAHGVEPPPNAATRHLGGTRTGSLLLDALAAVRSDRMRKADGPWQRRLEATRRHLSRIREYADVHGIELLVLLIPDRQDLIEPSRVHRAATALFEELDLVVLDPAAQLSDTSYAALPDVHWSDEGHRRVGRLLAACAQRLMTGAGASRCVPLFSEGP